MAGAGGADGVHRDARIAVGAVLNQPGRRALRPFHGGSGFQWCAPRWPPADEIGDKLTGHHIETRWPSVPQLINLQQQAPRQLNSVVDR